MHLYYYNVYNTTKAEPSGDTEGNLTTCPVLTWSETIIQLNKTNAFLYAD